MRNIISNLEVLLLPVLLVLGFYSIQYSNDLGVADKYSSYVGLGIAAIAFGVAIGISGFLLKNKKRSLIKAHAPILILVVSSILLLLVLKLLWG
jgi:hypothetical protein